MGIQGENGRKNRKRAYPKEWCGCHNRYETIRLLSHRAIPAAVTYLNITQKIL
jgi:hypothetical protein